MSPCVKLQTLCRLKCRLGGAALRRATLPPTGTCLADPNDVAHSTVMEGDVAATRVAAPGVARKLGPVPPAAPEATDAC